MKRKKGFTLVELLVVIAIIALLLSIMMPALNAAKKKAHKIVCMTHMRSLIQGVHVYAQSYNDNIPSSVKGMNAALNFYAELNGSGDYKGFVNLGRLYDTKIIDKPAIFYCPSQNNPYLREKVGWTFSCPIDGLEKKATGYMYGLMAQIVAAPRLEMKSTKLNALKGKALISDDFIPVKKKPAWAHEGKGLASGFGDAHVEFVKVKSGVIDTAARQNTDGSSMQLQTADLFSACMFELLAGKSYYMQDYFPGTK